MIRALLYLMASKPDIMFCVCMCVRFQANSNESHLNVVKSILRYLKDTSSIGLLYSKISLFELRAFSDVNFKGCKINKKSTSGTCQFLGNMLVLWFTSCCAQLL